MPEGLLSGLKVVDVSHHLSGPYCSKIMASFGAEVIKIEKPGEGDPARALGPFPGDIPHLEKSGTFLYLNTGKKSLTLNLKTATGVKIFKELVRDTDVLLENFEPRVMPSLGLDYTTLEKINPRLVMTSITSYGQTGPYRDYKGDELACFATSGISYTLGFPEREPLKLGENTAQYLAGLVGFTGTQMALNYVDETGIGQQVDISVNECLTFSHYQYLIQYIYTGLIGKRNRTILIFPCKDGYAGTVVQQYQWPAVARLVGMPELAADPRFKTADDRTLHADELEDLLFPWFIEHTKEEIYHLGQAERMPSSFFATAEDLVQSPQYQARGFFVEIDHPVAGKVTYPGMPLKMGDLTPKLERAPLLGEHNEEIYCGRLGYQKEQLVQLRGLGII